jgi:hypothetical protein
MESILIRIDEERYRNRKLATRNAFPFSSPCVKCGCHQWSSGRCGVIDFVLDEARILSKAFENNSSGGAIERAQSLVPPTRIERATRGLGNRCSIQLSYGGMTLKIHACVSRVKLTSSSPSRTKWIALAKISGVRANLP